MADDDAILGAILAIAAGIAVGAGVVALLKMLSSNDEDDLDEGDEDDW